MRLPLILAVARGQSADAPTWRLTDSPTSQDWHTAKGRYCGKQLPLPTADETVNYHACSSKCGPDSYCFGDSSAPCFCSGYLPEFDHDGGSNALCVPQDRCRAMCEALPQCAG